MASTRGGLVDQGSGTTDESAVTSGSDDHKGLTTLDTGRRVTLVTLVLVDSKRFTSDGRLIDLEESIFGHNATISGDNSTLFWSAGSIGAGRPHKTHLLNLKDITGNDLRGINLEETTVTEHNSLESERLLELVDNGTSLEFLDETDRRVKQQKRADDTEIDPVLETRSKNGSSLVSGRKMSVQSSIDISGA
jgi:hypothetical protein